MVTMILLKLPVQSFNPWSTVYPDFQTHPPCIKYRRPCRCIFLCCLKVLRRAMPCGEALQSLPCDYLSVTKNRYATLNIDCDRLLYKDLKVYLNGWFNNRSEEPVPAHTRIPSSAFRAAWAAFCAPLAAAPDGEDDAKSPRKIVTDH